MSDIHPATTINPNDDQLGTGWDAAVAVVVGEASLVTVAHRASHTPAVVIVVAIVGTTVWYRRRNRRLRAQVAELVPDTEKLGNVAYDSPARPPPAAKRSSRYYWEH